MKEGFILFRKDKLFIPGIVFFVAMFFLKMILPRWTGVENGVIENLQMLWLFAGMYYCYKQTRIDHPDWGGCQKALWYAGMIFFFMVIMREISWGRALFPHPNGKPLEYSEMGLYGKLVHPMVGILCATFLYLIYKAKVWLFLKTVKLPIGLTIQLTMFVIVQWFAEHRKIKFFAGDVAEELTEFGAYMILFMILYDIIQELKKKA